MDLMRTPLVQLRLCSVVFDLPSPTEAELKTTTLLELVDFCNHTQYAELTVVQCVKGSHGGLRCQWKCVHRLSGSRRLGHNGAAQLVPATTEDPAVFGRFR